jgi:hypothetical protein
MRLRHELIDVVVVAVVFAVDVAQPSAPARPLPITDPILSEGRYPTTIDKQPVAEVEVFYLYPMLTRCYGSKLSAPPPPILANPGQDSEPRSIVPQFTEDGDCGDLSDDRNCDTYPEQKENSASLPEYAGQSRAGYLANLLHGVEGSEATSLARRVLGRDVGYSRGPGGSEGRLAHVVHGAGSSHADKRP